MKNPDRGVRKPQTNSSSAGANSTATQRQEIAERERTEAELRRLSRALRTLSHCNHAVVRAGSEQELLESVCRNMVSVGGYRMAWVGVGNQDLNKTITPLAHAGFEDGYLQSGMITWADNEHGRRPAGTAIRTGQTAIARNIKFDPNMQAWREEALKRGYASSIALPILLEGGVFGAVAIYAEEPDAFDSAEVQLLTELTEELAYSIQALRTRIESARAEEALRNSAAKFQAIVENSRDGILFADAENRIVYRSPSYQSINGFTDEERLGHVGYETVHPDDVEALRRAWQLIVAHPGKTYEIADYRIRHKNGTWKWVESSATNLLANPHVGAIVVTTRDLTERTLAEQRVRESEEKFRKAFMTGADASYIATLKEGRLIEANARFYEVFGYSHEEMAGKTSLELGLYLDPEDRQKAISEVISKGIVRELELKGRKKDGTLITALLSMNILQGGDEPLVLGAVTDITERKKAEEALRESEARLKEAEQLAHLGSATWDVATDTTTWSEELYRIMGREPGGPTPKQKERSACYTPESGARLESAAQHALATGEPYDLEVEVVRPDGTSRHAHARGAAQRGPDGRIIRLYGTLQDITERRKLEEQFRQAQKMEAVGRLAGGVAHDFNNLLTVINGYSEMALEALDRNDPKRTYMSEIRKAGDRAAGLTRQLLAFSRQQVLAPRVLDLNVVVVDMEKMLRRLIGEDVDLAVVQCSVLGKVKADPGQIEQIIMNLVVNARDAMPHGGKLAITTTNTELQESDIDKVPSLVRGHYVMLAVGDTGTGMDAQTQAHIFEPFFTTKEQGKGTGLGLATVYGIVKQSGGYIAVHSVLGQGTSFKIYLPRVDEPSEPLRPLDEAVNPVGGSETILLVEDEVELRTLAFRILQARGYRVLESATAEEALRISSQEPGPIHLLLTDVVMPGMSGRRVAEQIVPMRPKLKVLYMSGYTDDSVFRNGVLETGTAFLQKPFTPSSLARKVREVLIAQKPA